jgi:hypothetical protein
MGITSLTSRRSGNATVVTAVSDLVPGVDEQLLYHWYVDGVYLGLTSGGSRAFAPEAGEQVRVDVVDSVDAAFDADDENPGGAPARRLLWWVRSIDSDIDHYRVEQQADGGAWSLLGMVPHVATAWEYSFLTPRLDDLTEYAWRIVPVDAAGNTGTAIDLGSEDVVRTPDAPSFTAAYNAVGETVTIDE